MKSFRFSALALAVLLLAPQYLHAQGGGSLTDTAGSAPLTATQLVHYIAVKRALTAYWQAPGHAALLTQARLSEPSYSITVGPQRLAVGVFDYPALVRRDSSLNAIFTANQLHPAEFAPTQVAVFKALGTLSYDQAIGIASPQDSSTLGRNVTLVRTSVAALASAGVALQFNGTANGPGALVAAWAASHHPKFDNTGVSDTSVFAPLRLPPGNELRSGSGRPGPRYWQNRADYDLRARLDTATKTLFGHEVLRYTNNSPDTLHAIWMQTEQNAFAQHSLASLVYAQTSRFGGRGFQGGDVLDHFEQLLPGRNRRATDSLDVTGTITKVYLARPLAPGHLATFDVAWHFRVPQHGGDRMGRNGSLYEIAQWYPRVCVYDDVRGWNTEPYLGQGEFYLEYGDYTMQVTLPAGYIVAGTGVLRNPQDVYTAAERSRLAEAAHDTTVVHVITPAEIASGAARPKKAGMLTWKFTAHNVRDAVWAAAPDYIFDATNYAGHLAYAYYRPSAVGTWKHAADMARMSIEEYSQRWFLYPYPQISVTEGPVSGMEYPMLAMESRNPNRFALYGVITHEIGHQWFPMIVGSNERMNPWMDEGFNTFINTFSEARRYPQNGTQEQRSAAYRREVEQAMRAQLDGPIVVPPDRTNPGLLGLEAYDKPSAGLDLLRQEILGPKLFDESFRTYVGRWAFKHPTPDDFFRTMENASGQRLDWFFREWFLENDDFDQSIDTVATKQVGDTEQVTVLYGNRARGVLPIRARFTFSDGSVENFDYPAMVWSMNTTYYVRRYAFVGKTLTKIELDPTGLLVDINRANNVWTAPHGEAASRGGGAVRRLTFAAAAYRLYVDR
ncbi:MAG: M1 family metallopeptidase [Gemmatimonadaceae bacterium]